jgi:hypothetical protein
VDHNELVAGRNGAVFSPPHRLHIAPKAELAPAQLEKHVEVVDAMLTVNHDKKYGTTGPNGSDPQNRVGDGVTPVPSHTTVRAVPHTAVHFTSWKRCWVSSSETNPSTSNELFGYAAFIWLAPAFHHGPRPLPAGFHARLASSPRVCSRLFRVAGYFHWRNSRQRNLRRIHPSRSCSAPFTSVSRKYDVQPVRPAGRTKKSSYDCS